MCACVPACLPACPLARARARVCVCVCVCAGIVPASVWLSMTAWLFGLSAVAGW